MLMSAAEYRESLRRHRPTVFVNGERVESMADNPRFAPGINAIGITYDFAVRPEYENYMVETRTPSSRARPRTCERVRVADRNDFID